MKGSEVYSPFMDLMHIICSGTTLYCNDTVYLFCSICGVLPDER